MWLLCGWRKLLARTPYYHQRNIKQKIRLSQFRLISFGTKHLIEVTTTSIIVVIRMIDKVLDLYNGFLISMQRFVPWSIISTVWQCHLDKIRITKQKAVGGIWMKNFGKWVLIYAWLGLCPYFERVVPTSGSNRRTVRWYFEWRDPVLVTVQHGDPMRLQGVPHIHCVVTENIGNKVIYKSGQTLKNKLGLKDRFKTQGVHSFE